MKRRDVRRGKVGTCRSSRFKIPKAGQEKQRWSPGDLFPPDQLPERLDWFLSLGEYEVIPIEVGKTKADSRLHQIQASRRTPFERGTVVEVILPGLRSKSDKRLIQKPVVIRGD